MGYGNGGSYGTATSGSIGGGQSSIPSTPATPLSQLGTQASRLTETLEALHGALSELEGRLEPTLHAAPPTASQAKEASPQYGTKLANLAAQQADVAQAALVRVRDLIQRIDL